MASPGFWDRPDAAREVMAESARLKGWVGPWNALNTKANELGEIAELLKEEPTELQSQALRTEPVESD